MPKIIFRETALSDVREIKDYYSKLSLLSCERVISDISDTIDYLKIFPRVGRPLQPSSHRRIVTPKYRYVIIYRDTADCVEIIGVFRNQTRIYDET